MRILCWSLVFSLCWCSSSAMAAERPHIVCYIADDFGVADSGCYGHPFVRTPHIDRLAAEGMRFTRAFAGSPTCAPSRSIFYTGLMSARTGAHPNHWGVNPGTKSIAHYLADAGYHVAVLNKVHVKPYDSFPFEAVKAGKTQERGGGKEIDPAVLDRWLTMRLANHPDQPLCLFLCDNNTHLVWPDDSHPGSAQIEIPPYLPDSPTTRASLGRYYTEVECLDDRVGECVEVLRKHDIFDESLFVFTADQGPAWLHGKWTLYDPGIHVPLIARWPGSVKTRTVSDAIVSLVDLTPTLVQVGGGTVPAGLDGRSFVPSLKDASVSHRSEVFATHTGDGEMNNYPCRAIRTGRYKLIWNLRPDLTYTTHLTKAAGKDRRNVWDAWATERKTNPSIGVPMDAYQTRPEFELFDLKSDPNELSNLASVAEYQDVFNQLKNRLSAWMDAQNDGRNDMAYFLAQKSKSRRRSKTTAPASD